MAAVIVSANAPGAGAAGVVGVLGLVARAGDVLGGPHAVVGGGRAVLGGPHAVVVGGRGAVLRWSVRSSVVLAPSSSEVVVPSGVVTSSMVVAPPAELESSPDGATAAYTTADSSATSATVITPVSARFMPASLGRLPSPSRIGEGGSSAGQADVRIGLGVGNAARGGLRRASGGASVTVARVSRVRRLVVACLAVACVPVPAAAASLPTVASGARPGPPLLYAPQPRVPELSVRAPFSAAPTPGVGHRRLPRRRVPLPGLPLRRSRRRREAGQLLTSGVGRQLAHVRRRPVPHGRPLRKQRRRSGGAADQAHPQRGGLPRDTEHGAG